MCPLVVLDTVSVECKINVGVSRLRQHHFLLMSLPIFPLAVHPTPPPPPPISHTVRRQTVKRSEVRQMPTLPRGGGEDLVREEQVSSRKVKLHPPFPSAPPGGQNAAVWFSAFMATACELRLPTTC